MSKGNQDGVVMGQRQKLSSCRIWGVKEDELRKVPGLVTRGSFYGNPQNHLDRPKFTDSPDSRMVDASNVVSSIGF